MRPLCVLRAFWAEIIVIEEKAIWLSPVYFLEEP
jgi:hypothetical protein